MGRRMCSTSYLRRIEIPTYEYQCKACDHKFTQIARMSDCTKACEEPCPECKAEGTVERYYGADTHLEWSDPWQLGTKKPPSDWREFLGRLKKNTPGAADFRD